MFSPHCVFDQKFELMVMLPHYNSIEIYSFLFLSEMEDKTAKSMLKSNR